MGFAESYVKGYVGIGGTELLSGEEVADVGRRWISNSRYIFGGGGNQSDIVRDAFEMFQLCPLDIFVGCFEYNSF